MSHTISTVPIRNHPPGDLAIWIFILAELSVFAIFFSVYAFARANHVEMFNHYQQTLNQTTALLNTLTLLTSSYFVVRGVMAIHNGDRRGLVRWFWAAIAMGAVFLVLKGGEFHHHYAAGINLRTNLFYMFYFSMTFFHFMHVILGMGILAAVAIKGQQGGYTAEEHTGVETGASYWHMVDLVWLILFPLIYVMR